MTDGTSAKKYGAPQTYHTAAYLRVSKQDAKGDVSNSIENQKKLILSFLQTSPEMVLEEIYVDDGLTGTNWNRPAFEAMLLAAGRRKINCIVVKDLSRLGRNYLDTGSLIETVFPFLGVRLVAVNDLYDSAKEDFTQSAYVIPLKNIMNESFVRDISQKTKSAQRSRMKAGKFVGSLPAYGYMREAGSRGKLIVDPIAAKTVRRIFDLSLCGYGDYKIAKILNEEKILPPYQYKQQKGLIPPRTREVSKEWRKNSVAAILKNPIYTGALVQNRKTTQSPKGQRIALPANAWVVSENTHEAIVEQRQFEAVQKRKEIRRKAVNKADRTAKNQALFGGKVYCGLCQKAMLRRWDHGRYRYVCSSRHAGGSCTGKSIREEILLPAFYTMVELDHKMHAGNFDPKQSPQKKIKGEKKRANLEKLYIGYQRGLLSKQEFLTQKTNLGQRGKTDCDKRTVTMLGSAKSADPVAIDRLTRAIQRIDVYSTDRFVIKINDTVFKEQAGGKRIWW